MVYTLSPNVYLVRGASGGCLYDFNRGKLYHLNCNLTNLVAQINNGSCDISIFNKEQKTIFSQMMKLGLITSNENFVHYDIQELKRNNFHCEFAWIEITNKCNLKCIHCYNESNIQADKIMSYDDYKMVINYLIKLGVRKVQIIGGEPFFYQDLLKKMIDYTINKFDYIEIFTNGTLVSDNWFEFLAQNQIHIALSVYSYKSNMHDKVTQCKGSWERTNRTIQKLKEYHIPYRVCNVLMNGIELGKKNTSYYTLRKDKDVARMSGRANFNLLSDELIQKRLITKKSFRHPISKNFCVNIISGHNCFAHKIYISADLIIYPCVMERRFNHGKISPNTGISLNKAIQGLNKDSIKECCTCEYRYCCFDCRPNSLSGDQLEKPWYCTYNPSIGKWTPKNIFIKKLREKWGVSNKLE